MISSMHKTIKLCFSRSYLYGNKQHLHAIVLLQYVSIILKLKVFKNKFYLSDNFKTNFNMFK